MKLRKFFYLGCLIALFPVYLIQQLIKLFRKQNEEPQNWIFRDTKREISSCYVYRIHGQPGFFTKNYYSLLILLFRGKIGLFGERILSIDARVHQNYQPGLFGLSQLLGVEEIARAEYFDAYMRRNKSMYLRILILSLSLLKPVLKVFTIRQTLARLYKPLHFLEIRDSVQEFVRTFFDLSRPKYD